MGFGAGFTMRMVHIALLYCCCFACSVSAQVDGKLDIASGFKRRLTAWALSRGKRDVRGSKLQSQEALASGHPFVRVEDVKENLNFQPSPDAHIRVKRYRYGLPRFPQLHLNRPSCQLGTCQVQKLSHRLNQLLNNPEKDNMARWSTWSPNSYGRKRRSLRSRVALLPAPGEQEVLAGR
ncbi:adrenomedullin a isoform X1 [Scyliorhinus canicula]|uniref:adrenomedullin a isoform X1 n=1 Tax=Scyliorhinus canicula TaxID=7830 RepID=UPI0018F2E606|nr:adrenomedullin a isoform X1 [Scyliorhinus canicula]